ncbi:hypothetical protein HMPREF0494_1527 [Limosilactobacillus antri DSM 16041]|uniref:Uncharacterized protein n=1 Tax=Limosilactobacillus antri DSM 16041 TaxID=525309 RepID=C8P883_9LACO|nr:hypothetical protein HMPREF0494_1527 [Limosilactobacillus antri DSM 16041]
MIGKIVLHCVNFQLGLPLSYLVLLLWEPSCRKRLMLLMTMVQQLLKQRPRQVYQGAMMRQINLARLKVLVPQ